MVQVELFDPNSKSQKHIHKPQVLKIIQYTSQSVVSQSSHFPKGNCRVPSPPPQAKLPVLGAGLVLRAWDLHLCPQTPLSAPTPFTGIPKGTMGLMGTRRTMADGVPGITRIHYKGRNTSGLWQGWRLIPTPSHQPRSPPPPPAGHAPSPYLGTLAK